MHSRRLAVFFVLALLQPVVWAETCKYLDSEGRVIYSNTPNSPPKGATKVKCFEDPSPKPTPANARNSDSKPANPDTSASEARPAGYLRAVNGGAGDGESPAADHDGDAAKPAGRETAGEDTASPAPRRPRLLERIGNLDKS